MRFLRRHTVLGWGLRYLLAAGLVVAAFGARLALTMRFGPGLPPYITLYPAVLMVAFLGGLGPGLLATVMAIALVGYCLLPAPGQFAIASPMDSLGLVIFTGMGLAVSVAGEAYQRYRGKAANYDRQAAVHAGETRYRLLFEMITEGFSLREILFDAAGKPYDLRYLSVNPAFERLTGLKAADLIGRTILELFPLAEPVWFEFYGKVVRTGEPASMEAWFGPLGRCFQVNAFCFEPGICGVGFLDITDRRQAEETLDRTVAELREAQVLTHIGSWSWDAATDVTTWSEEIDRILGFDSAMQFPTFQEKRGRVYPVEDWERVNEAMQRTVRTGEAYELDVRGFRNQELIWLNARGDAVRDADGRIIGLRGTIQDITKREQVAEALRLSQAWLRVTLASIGDAVIACDTLGRVTFLNPVAASLTGWEPAQAIGQPVAHVFNIINEQSRRPAEDIVALVLREKRMIVLANHTALLDRGGRQTPIADSAAPITDDQGAVTGVVLVFRDVTEAKQVEWERTATIELLSLVNASANTPDLLSAATAYFQQQSGCEAVGIRLREGDDYPYLETRGFPGEFVRAESLLCARDAEGHTVRDHLGHPALECMCGNVLCGRFDSRHPFFTQGGSFWTNSTTQLLGSANAGDRQPLTRNGCNGEGYESVALVPLQSGGERFGLLQLNDRRKALFSPERISLWEQLAGHVAGALAKFRIEQELRVSEMALKEADRRKDEFLAVLSHELRNPLAAIVNSLYLLDHEVPGSGSAHRAQEVIGRQAHQLSRLVDDLLDVTRISSNKIRLQLARIDLVQVVQQAAEDHRDSFESNGVLLACVAPKEAVWVLADAARVTQMVDNLLINAGKFTDRGGSVALEIQAQDAQAVVTVSDTGIGMDSDMLERVFHPFAQADRSLDRSRGGLGLGLALTKGLAELHGGSVAVSSPGLGKGSSFVLTLPMALGLESQRGDEPAHAARLQSRRVLVIEDNLDAALTLKLLLELSAHEVVIAHSGREGLAKAKSYRPEIVLCDIGLPDMDGYTVARTLGADPESRPSCLIAMTGYGQEEDKRRALEAGFDHHLTKPADLDELQRLLDF